MLKVVEIFDSLQGEGHKQQTRCEYISDTLCTTTLINKITVFYTGENMPGKPWTQEEIEYLEKNYGKMKTQLIAQHLQRSLQAIWGKARNIGLHLGSNYWQTKLDEDEIRRMIDENVDLQTIAKRFDTRTYYLRRYLNRRGILWKKSVNERFRAKGEQLLEQFCRRAGKTFRKISNRISSIDYYVSENTPVNVKYSEANGCMITFSNLERVPPNTEFWFFNKQGKCYQLLLVEVS